jgi:hypothetical protein
MRLRAGTLIFEGTVDEMMDFVGRLHSKGDLTSLAVIGAVSGKDAVPDPPYHPPATLNVKNEKITADDVRRLPNAQFDELARRNPLPTPSQAGVALFGRYVGSRGDERPAYLAIYYRLLRAQRRANREGRAISAAEVVQPVRQRSVLEFPNEPESANGQDERPT